MELLFLNMRLKYTGQALLLILFGASSCVKQANLNRRNAEPILVVEGSITTDSVPYTVRLSYSGPYENGLSVPDEYLEKEAGVALSDDEGKITSLVHTGNGVYETTDRAFVGKPGRSYQLTIQLKDGKKYISKQENMRSPVPVSNIKAGFFADNTFNYPTSMHVFIDTEDPADEENYYKWNFYSWTLRQTHGIPCGFGCIMYEYCYQKFTDKQVRIFSDASSNGNDIKNREVGLSYIYTYGDAYINIEQLSLSREAYQFWQRYDDQVARTGSILDPLPSSIRGNVYNETDSADFALGYFFASAISRRRAKLVPYNITEYLLDLTARKFIPDGPVNCFEYFPNALSYPPPPATQYPPPPGWENAERVEVRW
jgi:hypothetical protein